MMTTSTSSAPDSITSSHPSPSKNAKATTATVSTPTVTWAQRTNNVFLTIMVPSVKNANVLIEKQKIHFDGLGGSGASENVPYEVDLDLFDEIDPESSTYQKTPLGVTFNIVKHQKDQAYWPRLLTSTVKPHFLKTDFNKWKDEDESDDEADGNDNIMSAIQGSGMNAGKGPMDFDFSKMGMGNLDMGPDSDDEEEQEEEPAKE